MPGPNPKPPGTRARRNTVATAAKLHPQDPDAPTVEAPSLPQTPVPWHEMTLSWWNDVWASPMAPEFDKSDIHGLYSLAVLVNDFWTAETLRDRKDAAQEIRLQSYRYGLSPMDRRRLQWEIEKTDEAQAKGNRRRKLAEEKGPEAPKETNRDPRAILRAVK